jgi:hypothetical protein
LQPDTYALHKSDYENQPKHNSAMAAKPSTTLKSHPTSSAPKNPDSAAAAASTSSGRKPHDNYQLPRTGYSPAAVIISQLTEQKPLFKTFSENHRRRPSRLGYSAAAAKANNETPTRR